MSTSVEIRGTVLEAMPNARYLCRIDSGRAEAGREIVCHVGGDMRMKVVRVLPGEGVVMELSPLDPSKGRIVGKTGPTPPGVGPAGR
ncbi:MAG: translation initiation factor IF-1 [Planctomycetota bacterium]